jgi:hypothetical protein
MSATTDFGRDSSCTDSLKTGRLSSGPLLVAETAYRRLITPRGALRGGEEEADFGLDLLGLIGDNANVESLAASLPGQIRGELRKDERITGVSATVTYVTEGPATTFTISIACETGEGPFTLRVSVDEVTVELLGITTEED